MDEDLENVGVREQLGEHYPLGSFVGTDLVDRGPARHAESDHDPTSLFFDQLLTGHPEILESRNRPSNHLETLAVTRAALELVDGFGPHVVAGEHGVGHTYAIHGKILP